MSEFKVQKGVKMPAPRVKYPWRQMKVGDSFAAPIRSHQSVRTAASQTGKRLGTRYAVRKVNAKSVRVWRVK